MKPLCLLLLQGYNCKCCSSSCFATPTFWSSFTFSPINVSSWYWYIALFLCIDPNFLFHEGFFKRQVVAGLCKKRESWDGSVLGEWTCCCSPRKIIFKHFSKNLGNSHFCSPHSVCHICSQFAFVVLRSWFKMSEPETEWENRSFDGLVRGEEAPATPKSLTSQNAII